MHQNRRTRFVLSGSGGWKAFVKEHELKVGDICTFELIPGTQFTFQVHIFRDSLRKQTIQLVQHLKVVFMFSYFFLCFQTIPNVSNIFILLSSAESTKRREAT